MGEKIDELLDDAEGADARAYLRGIIIGLVGGFNAFADRFDYTPLTGVETAGVIGAAGALVLVARRVRRRRLG